MVKVSVIIPTYNRANMILDAIDSVLRQTFQDFEIIIVDDGSTDNTRQLIDSLNDHRISYIYQENQGVVAAINTGIDASHGTYLSILGSDDMLLDRAFEAWVKVLDKNPDVAFVFSQVKMMDEKGDFIELRKVRPKGESYISAGIQEIPHFIINGNRISQSQALIRKSHCVEAGNFDPIFREGSEDFDLWIRLLRSHHVAYIAEPLSKRRVHTSNISSTRDIKELEEKHLIIIDRIYMGGFDEISKSKAYSYLYWRLAQQTADKKTKSLYLSRALSFSPGIYLSPGMLLSLCFQFAKIILPSAIKAVIKRKRSS